MAENSERPRTVSKDHESFTEQDKRFVDSTTDQNARQMSELREESAKLLRARRDRENMYKRNVLRLSGLATGLALFGTSLAWFQIRTGGNRSLDNILHQADANYMQVELTALRQEVQAADKTSNELKVALAQFDAEVKSGKGTNSLSPADRQSLARAVSSSSELDKRLSSLENALLATPEKSLSLPLLRQQMTDLQERSQGDVHAVHDEISRLYGFMQWFFGLMLTTLLAVGGLVVNSLRQGLKKES